MTASSKYFRYSWRMTKRAMLSPILVGVLLGVTPTPAMLAQKQGQLTHLQPGSLPTQGSKQLLIVRTSGWNAVDGKLQRYQRASADQRWVKVGDAVPVVVGKSGMAWGLGVAPSATDKNGHTSLHGEPMKREGDGRSPAGVFALGTSFGYAASAPGGWKMPYLELTPSIECVDDLASNFYNQTLDRGSVSPDWKSSEHMRSADEFYRLGVIVQHNAAPARPGGGSCIFLHIWGGKGQGTAGCTAMAESQLEALVGWLDPTNQPLLVQMPRNDYRRLKKEWQLP